MGLPAFIRINREVSLTAATVPHPNLVHPQWEGCVDFWCDAVRRMTSQLGQRFEHIPPDMWDNPAILNTLVRYPGADELYCDSRVYQALLRPDCDRETLRECVQYAANARNEG